MEHVHGANLLRAKFGGGCGRAVSPVPEQIWRGLAQSRSRCGSWQLVYSVQRMQAVVQRSRNQGEQHAAELLLLADTKTRSTLLHALRAF